MVELTNHLWNVYMYGNASFNCSIRVKENYVSASDYKPVSSLIIVRLSLNIVYASHYTINKDVLSVETTSVFSLV